MSNKKQTKYQTEQQRQARTSQIILAVIGVIVILSMVLALVAK